MPISPYVVVFCVVLIALFVSRIVPSLNKGLYYLVLVILAVFLACRYGQGTDYSMYEGFYLAAPSKLDFTNIYFSDAYHTEIGWKVAMTVLRMAGISFELFVAFISIVMMICLHRCITHFSQDKMLSLVIAFPTLYLIGFFSMLRQGLVTAIFLGFLLDLLIRHKRPVLYVAICILLMTIHTISAVFLAAYLVLAILDKVHSRSWLYLLLGICVIAGFLPLALGGIRSVLASLPFFVFYYLVALFFWFALLEWVVCFIVFVPTGYPLLASKRFEHKATLEPLLNLYVFGLSLYFLFLISPNAASRFYFPFESLEVILVPLVFSGTVRWKNVVTVLVCCLAVLFVIKNINACIEERGYYSFVTWQTYPYVSVFESHSELSLYRQPYPSTGMP